MNGISDEERRRRRQAACTHPDAVPYGPRWTCPDCGDDVPDAITAVVAHYLADMADGPARRFAANVLQPALRALLADATARHLLADAIAEVEGRDVRPERFTDNGVGLVIDLPTRRLEEG